jgi:hypothetical protein
MDSQIIVSGSHLLDTEGYRITKNDVTMPIITLCILNAIDLARIRSNK